MKPRSSPPIRLAFSCHEDYNQMLPCDGGKFCGVCNKVVHDLTKKSNQEILDLLSTQGSICGKLRKQQTQPVNIYKKPFQRIFASLLMTLGLYGLGKIGYSQDIKFRPEEPDSITFEESEGINLTNEENIFVGVIYSKQPEYKYGGDEGLKKFLAENLVYPKDSVEGKVYVTFTVNECGEVENAKIPRGLSPEADKEVLRVIQMLEFTPEELAGRPTKINYRLPITFTRK